MAGRSPMRSAIGPACLSALAALAVPCVALAQALDQAGAERAVRASNALIPGDDIRSDVQAHDIRIVDLDGDGVDEILFHRTARCTGANFDCPNELVVMTALAPGDRRISAPRSGPWSQWEADLAAVRDSGHAEDASVQVPGLVRRIEVSGNSVVVSFHVQQDSPICLRRFFADGAYRESTHCPPPGDYVWTYHWAPGKIEPVLTPPAR